MTGVFPPFQTLRELILYQAFTLGDSNVKLRKWAQEGGELFDKIIEKTWFNKTMAKLNFHQMASDMEYLHVKIMCWTHEINLSCPLNSWQNSTLF